MREIKFRAWDTVVDKMDYAGECTVSIDFFGRTFDDGETPPRHIDYRTKLMQYTGLKDKNGKEIYEGDIIETPVGNREVKWLSVGWSLLTAGDTKVIGNIYENPELLK
jgi:uncharacterized phage protein (TIGR01671 family)